jgi:hypothetical protein
MKVPFETTVRNQAVREASASVESLVDDAAKLRVRQQFEVRA